MTKKKTKLIAQGLSDAIDLLIELDHALDRDDEEVSRELLRALIGHSGWLTDYDDIFAKVEQGTALDMSRCSQWCKWQLGNLRLEAAIDDGSLEEQTMDRETKPYTAAVANELIQSSVRTTAQRQAMKPETGTHTSLEERTEDNLDSEDDDFSELDDLVAEIVEDNKK